MHVGAKRMAIAGLLVAFSVVMVILSSVIETSSLFFIAAASFCVGVAVREWGLRYSLAFWAAATLLNFFVAPNKMYCVTFGAMGLYLWLSECLWKFIGDAEKLKYRTAKLWVGRYVCFNLMYIPVLFFFPKLIFTGKMNGLAATILFLAGQAVLYIYEMAYGYFQARIWGRLRVRLTEKRN